MLYLEYELARIRYKSAREDYEELLNEKERLFRKTQPKSVQFDKERVNGGTPENAFETYIIELERKGINERLENLKDALDERQGILERLEADLRRSKDITDVIYVCKYIEHIQIGDIAEMVSYSRSQVYRIIEKIENRVKDATKCDKMRQNATNDVV